MTMTGDLKSRGIGFYLEASDIYVDAKESDFKIPEELKESAGLNPGHFIGYTLGAAYVVWPLDFIPDFIPVVGQMDDVAIMMAAGRIGGLVWDIGEAVYDAIF